jgi:hypothetical protein
LNTRRLLFWSAIAYATLLVLVRGVFPSESTPSISLTGIPLVVIVIMIVRDLASKSTSPTLGKTAATPTGFRGSVIQFLSGQLRVAASASDSYFENVIRARLKDLLTTKVSIETGLENENVRRILADPSRGRRLLVDESLYGMLYGPVPHGRLARMTMISDAIDLIGAWKG